MKSFALYLLLSGTLLLGFVSCASLDTTPEDPQVARLLGTRPLALQWISWDDFGEATVTRSGSGPLRIRGEQRGVGNEDYLTIDGTIREVTETGFTFEGTIVTKVSHNNGGEPFTREGVYHFGRYHDRGFWRLVEMENPEGHVDYVDIFDSLETAKAPPLD